VGFMDVWGFDPEQVPAVRRSAEEWQPNLACHEKSEDEWAAEFPLAESDQIRELWRIFGLEAQCVE
jgi:hypothetical protein